MRKPNFIIVGAPRSGTTAMCEYLKMHPEIFMSTPKEPYFFGSDLTWRVSGRPPSKEQYLALFSKAGNTIRAGEASVLYLYSKKAAIEIKAFSPSAQIVVMLRNPVDMMYSMHSQLLYSFNEDIVDFEEALKAEKDRKSGLHIPLHCICPQYLYYKDIARCTEQINRYFNVFGQKNVHIIIFDDFKKETAQIYRECLRFLRVNDKFKPTSFQVINPNKKVRSKVLYNFLHYPPQIIRLSKYLFSKSLRQKLLVRFRKLNTKNISRTPMDPKLRNYLQEEFKPEVEKLSELLNRDLTDWIKS